MGIKVGMTPQGKTSVSVKPTSGIFDRYKEHKEAEDDLNEDQDARQDLSKTMKANKYGKTPGGWRFPRTELGPLGESIQHIIIEYE